MPRTVALVAVALTLAASLVAQSGRARRLVVAWQLELHAPSFGSAAVADIDGDGRLEVAFGTYFGDNSVRVLNGEDGSEYWRYDAGYACVDASLRFADLDGDGDLELVVPISNKGQVLAFDAKTGDEVWSYGTQPIECTDTPPAILDVDGDGDLEVVHGTFKGRLHRISGASGKLERVYDVVSHFVQTGPAILDVDGDHVNDLVCATFKGDNRVYATDGRTGAELWRFEIPGKHMGMYHGCSVGDLTGDGVPELVIAAYDGKVHCLRARDGKELWATATGDRFIMSPTVLTDLDGDGELEVVIASQRMTVLDRRGRVRWSKSCGKGGWDAVTRGASVADLDGDQRPDLASLSGAGVFRVFRAKDGATLYEFDAGRLTKHPVARSSHGVTLADLTGDGKLDAFFVVGSPQPRHGLAVCLTGFPGTGRGWYMLRHDARNTGNTGNAIAGPLLARIEGLTPKKTPTMRPSRPARVRPVRRSARPVGRSARPPGSRPRTPDRALSDAELLQKAKTRGIPKTVVEAALAANRYPVDGAKVAAFAETAAAHGFAAACLLVEAGRAHLGTVELLAATRREGDEARLLALADGPELPRFGKWIVLRALGIVDTVAMRNEILRRLRRKRDAGHFMSLAQAAARLRERRASPLIAAQILKFEPRWSGVERHLLNAVDAIGDPGAADLFASYLVDARARNHAFAVRALARRDAKRAGKVAVRVLDGKHSGGLSAANRRALRRAAGR